MLKQDKNEKRTERHSVTQEDFTPNSVVDDMLAKLPRNAFTNFRKTVLDTSCGIGNFLVRVLEKRLAYCETADDALLAVRTLYGVELMADNVEECRQRLYDCIIAKFPRIASCCKRKNFYLRAIIRNRIQWHDSLTFDYNHWKPISHTKPTKEYDNVSFHEAKGKDDDQYPMWHKAEDTKESKQLKFDF